MMSDPDRVGRSSIQVEHRLKATARFRKIAAHLRENAETDRSTTLQFGEILLGSEQINFLIVSAGRAEIAKMSRQSPLLRDDSAPQ